MKTYTTLAGDIVTLQRFKEWWQVYVKNGSSCYTVFQSKSRTQSMSYIEQNYRMPCQGTNLGTWHVSQHKARIVRQISVYP